MKEKESKNHLYFEFVKRQSFLILILAALITLFFAAQIPKLRFDTDYLSLLPKESAYREGNFNSEKEEAVISLEEKKPSPPRERSPYTSSYFFVVESEDLFDPVLLSTLERVMKELEVLPEFGNKFSAFEYTTLENKGGRLSFVPLSPKAGDSSWSEEEARIFKERLLRDDVARNYLVSADGKALLIYYQIKPEGAGSDRLKAYSEILEPLREHARVYINVTAPISERVLHYLKKDLFTLLSLSLVCIILIYYLAFRSKRSVFLPLSLAFISLIWTLGMMSLLNFTLSIISIITPTIVITLGSSYSIHLLNEYFRQGAEGDPPDLPRVTARVGKTISLASLTTVIGFLSLLSAETRAFRRFGISVSLGVFFCALLSLTYLPALLSLFKAPKKRPAKGGKTGLPEKILETLAEVSLKRYPLSLIIFLLFLA